MTKKVQTFKRIEENKLKLSQSGLNEYIITNFPKISLNTNFSVLFDNITDADVPYHLQSRVNEEDMKANFVYRACVNFLAPILNPFSFKF